MRIVKVQRLDGIPTEFAPILFEAMGGCTNGQRLAVALYFMSDLSESLHRLRSIEANLRRIFPRSVRSRLYPDDYVDFAATAVRTIFNSETRAVREGGMAEDVRYWHNPRRGCWCNTELGNQYALQVLGRRDILVQCGAEIQNPSSQELPAVNRPYMEEEFVEVPSPAPDDPPADEIEGDGLLAFVDRILEGLPVPSSMAGPGPTSAGVELRGTREEVRALIGLIADAHMPSEATLTLTVSRDGSLHVAVRTTS